MHTCAQVAVLDWCVPAADFMGDDKSVKPLSTQAAAWLLEDHCKHAQERVQVSSPHWL